MKIIGNGSLRGLVLAAALSTGLGLGTHTAAQDQEQYLIELNKGNVTNLDNVTTTVINNARQSSGWVGSPPVLTGPSGMGMTELGPTLGGGYSEANGVDAGSQGPIKLPSFPNQSFTR